MAAINQYYYDFTFYAIEKKAYKIVVNSYITNGNTMCDVSIYCLGENGANIVHRKYVKCVICEKEDYTGRYSIFTSNIPTLRDITIKWERNYPLYLVISDSEFVREDYINMAFLAADEYPWIFYSFIGERTYLDSEDLLEHAISAMTRGNNEIRDLAFSLVEYSEIFWDYQTYKEKLLALDMVELIKHRNLFNQMSDIYIYEVLQDYLIFLINNNGHVDELSKLFYWSQKHAVIEKVRRLFFLNRVLEFCLQKKE